MPIFRVIKTKDYTTMSNFHFREKEMSLKAIGMLSLMLSLPDEWDYSVEGLTSIRCEAKNTINSILKELEDFGYLKRKRVYKDGKISGWQYNIYEKPLHLKNEDIENEDIEKQDIENCPQLNTNKVNTKKAITNKEENIKRYFENEEINELFIEFLNQRKKLKAVNSDRAISNLINKLKEYPEEVQIEMINNSITNSWKGIFPIKGTDIKKSNNQEQWELLKKLNNGEIQYKREKQDYEDYDCF